MAKPITCTNSSNDKHTNSVDRAAAERPLPKTFVPNASHVICARGKSQWDHEGNKRYRVIIAASTQKYSNASSKLDKSLIVSEIIDTIHRATDSRPAGGFVKKLKNGTWVQCNEHFAREKVTQSLRDGLHGKYKSSTRAKKQRRTQFSLNMTGNAERVIHSNAFVSQKIKEVEKDLQISASDYTVCTMLSRANSDILESMKKDADLLSRFHDATMAAKEADNSN